MQAGCKVKKDIFVLFQICASKELEVFFDEVMIFALIPDSLKMKYDSSSY